MSGVQNLLNGGGKFALEQYKIQAAAKDAFNRSRAGRAAFKLVGLVPGVGDLASLFIESTWEEHLETDADNDLLRPMLIESFDGAGRNSSSTNQLIVRILNDQLSSTSAGDWELLGKYFRLGRTTPTSAIVALAARAVLHPETLIEATELLRWRPHQNYILATSRDDIPMAWDRIGGRIMTEIGYVTNLLADSHERWVPSLSMCDGGAVAGPGSTTSDSIPAMLSNGEWVIRASAASALGSTTLSMLNQWDQLSPGQRSSLNGLLLPDGVLRRAGGGGLGTTASSGASIDISASLEQLGQLKARMEGIEGVTRSTRAEFDDLSGALTRGMNKALDDAKDRLGEATRALEAYRDSISAAVRQGHDLSDAASTQSKAQDELTEALKKQEDAQKALAVARASGSEASIASATRQLAESDQNVAAAKSKDGGFLSFLQQNLESAKTFAGQLEALRLNGASLEATQKIAQLGAATGGRVVGELLAGGQDAIEKANELVKTVEDVGLKAGEAAAQQFYGAGVASAQAYVDALSLQMETVVQPLLDSIQMRIEAALAAAAAAAASPPPRQEESVPRVPSFTAARAQEASAVFGAKNFASALATMGITPFADGGVVVRPTVGLVGEAGPEAVIPLSRFGGTKRGGDITVNLVVHGSVVQESDLVVSVRDGIAQLMRRRGLDPAIIGV